MSINKNVLFLSDVFFQGMVVTATILKEIFRHSKGNTEMEKTYIHAKV